MANSDDEDILFSSSRSLSNQQGKGLLGNKVKTIDDIMNGPKEDRRLKKTLALCASFLALGLSVAVLGPTLLALQKHLAVEFPKMSYIFIGRSSGYLVGSIIGGFLFDWVNTALLIGLTLLISGVGMLLAPFCMQLWNLCAVISTVGLAMGALDTGANVFCLRLWGKRSPPFLQALHFSFALGAFISPLLASPFIESGILTTTTVALDDSAFLNATTQDINSSSLATTPRDNISSIHPLSTDNQTSTPPVISSTTTLLNATSTPAPPSTTTAPPSTTTAPPSTMSQENGPTLQNPASSQFQKVYIIIGIITILISFSFLYFYCTSPANPPQRPKNAEENKSYNDFTNAILFLMFIFYFLYVGAEIGFGSYIFTFARFSGLNFSVSSATLLNAAFFGSFAFGRGLSICLAGALSARMMLILDITGCVLASVLLTLYGETIPIAVWVGTAFLGLSMASLFPAGISWLESFCKVTGNMASILIIGSALGEMCFPMLIGWLFGKDLSHAEGIEQGPIGLMYITLAASCLTAILFIILQYLATQNGVDYKQAPIAPNAVNDLLQGVEESFCMEELPSKKAAKQISKPIVPKAIQVKKHRE